MLYKLWSWRRLLRVPWTARRSNQSILEEINPEYSLEELMLKLKLQYFGHLMWRADSLEKTLMLGKTEGRRRRGLQRMRWLDDIINSMDMSWNKFLEIEMDREARRTAVHGVTNSRTWLGNWKQGADVWGETMTRRMRMKEEEPERCCHRLLPLLIMPKGDLLSLKSPASQTQWCYWDWFIQQAIVYCQSLN